MTRSYQSFHLQIDRSDRSESRVFTFSKTLKHGQIEKFDANLTIISLISLAANSGRLDTIETATEWLENHEYDLNDVPISTGARIDPDDGVSPHEIEVVITYDQQAQTIQITDQDRAFSITRDTIALLAAAAEQRDLDRFYEAREDDEHEIFIRRRIWTTSCIAASGILPCNGEGFIKSADAFAHIIAPQYFWEWSSKSTEQRLRAAIRAGIVILDPKTDAFLPSPSLSGWCAIFGSELNRIGSRLAIFARRLAGATDRQLAAIRASSAEFGGRGEASNHDLIAACEITSDYEDVISDIRNVIMPKISPLPMPAPQPA